MTSVKRKSYALDHWIGFVLAFVYLVVLVKTAPAIGYARDEGFYFSASGSYSNWFDLLFRDPSAAVQRAAVDSHWSVNHEHPGLVKSIFALSWNFLYKRWHFFGDEGTSFRFGGMCFAALGLWLIYIWGVRARSRSAGFVAATLFALMPRIFYHSHLDCFDVPIAVMWALCAYVYWRSLERPTLAWAIAAGIVFGLALDTKLNSWFLPPALCLHALVARGASLRQGLGRGELRVPPALWAMASIGPFVFMALWPWIWFDTVERLTAYAQFHLNHEYYNMVFLGATYWKPPMPRGYVWLMTAATVPAITLLLFAIGAGSGLVARFRSLFARSYERRAPDPRRTQLLWGIGILAQVAPWILSANTPIFGGTKHWFTAYPFLCLFAGVGFDVTAGKLRSLLATTRFARLPAGLVDAATFAAVVAAPLVETIHSHPWGLSNYTPLVGGASGAATLGLNRQFWGFTTGAVVDWLNQHAKPGEAVYIHDTAGDAWEMLHRDGRLLPRVQAAWSVQGSTFALYHHEEHMETIEYQIWTVYGTSTPVHIGVYDGVPIVYVYENKAQARR
jgi:4-amino-4-deoxy-L-arabinose transferase-like glycosyltransferase